MNAVQNIPTHEKIRLRREELKLTDIDVARAIRLSVHEYGDIEQHATEIGTLVELYHIKKLCTVLRLSLLDLFDIPCAFCNEGIPHIEAYWLRRSTLVQKRRQALGLSTEEVGDRVGFEEWEIKNIETHTAHLESWPVDSIVELSTVLQIPSQVLLDVQCMRCGR